MSGPASKEKRQLSPAALVGAMRIEWLVLSVVLWGGWSCAGSHGFPLDPPHRSARGGFAVRAHHGDWHSNTVEFRLPARSAPEA